jgi:hypothetical protein
LEQEYICGAVRGDSFPSMASSALGALVASLMTIEAAKILRGDLAASLASRQLVFDAQNHRLQITAGRRNPWCRWDHRTWVIEPWDRRPDTTALGDALDIFGCIRVEGHRFVTELICPGCGRRENALRLNRPPARCAACNRRMVTAGFGSLDRLDRGLAGGYTNLTLSQIGLRAGDIITGGDQRHRIQHRLLEAA